MLHCCSGQSFIRRRIYSRLQPDKADDTVMKVAPVSASICACPAGSCIHAVQTMLPLMLYGRPMRCMQGCCYLPSSAWHHEPPGSDGRPRSCQLPPVPLAPTSCHEWDPAASTVGLLGREPRVLLCGISARVRASLLVVLPCVSRLSILSGG